MCECGIFEIENAIEMHWLSVPYVFGLWDMWNVNRFNVERVEKKNFFLSLIFCEFGYEWMIVVAARSKKRYDYNFVVHFYR